jgi:hypothetical protein
MTDAQQERHERALRQWAAKIAADLPTSDDDARKVLAYTEQILDSFIANGKSEARSGVLN